MYTLQCTPYSVQCTVYNLQCTVYSVQCTVYSVQFTVYSIQCTVYTVQWQCSVYDLSNACGRSLCCDCMVNWCPQATPYGILFVPAITQQLMDSHMAQNHSLIDWWLDRTYGHNHPLTDWWLHNTHGHNQSVTHCTISRKPKDKGVLSYEVSWTSREQTPNPLEFQSFFIFVDFLMTFSGLSQNSLRTCRAWHWLPWPCLSGICNTIWIAPNCKAIYM